MNKQKLKKALNLLSWLALIAIVSINIIPSAINAFKQEGLAIESGEYKNIATEQLVVFPPKSGAAIAIFWATWCAPCKLEMQRLAASVHAGKIPRDRLYAINTFEDEVEVRRFLKQNDFPFVFINDTGLGQKLQINRTPTTLFIESGKIERMSSGLSLIGIWLAEGLF